VSLATDGQDGNGLQFENVWRTLSNFVLVSCKNHWKVKKYYGLLSLQKFTWYLPLDVPGAFCVWVKVFNLNFSDVLTKREENHRDTAPLSEKGIASWEKHIFIAGVLPILTWQLQTGKSTEGLSCCNQWSISWGNAITSNDWLWNHNRFPTLVLSWIKIHVHHSVK